jgi:hypothetical protein
VSEIYVLFCAQHLVSPPHVTAREKGRNKGFSHCRVGNTVSFFTSFGSILAFTTTHVFWANINWHYTTELRAL